MTHYDDEFDWRGDDYCPSTARRAFLAALGVLFATMLAGLALIWPFG